MQICATIAVRFPGIAASFWMLWTCVPAVFAKHMFSYSEILQVLNRSLKCCHG